MIGFHLLKVIALLVSADYLVGVNAHELQGGCKVFNDAFVFVDRAEASLHLDPHTLSSCFSVDAPSDNGTLLRSALSLFNNSYYKFERYLGGMAIQLVPLKPDQKNFSIEIGNYTQLRDSSRITLGNETNLIAEQESFRLRLRYDNSKVFYVSSSDEQPILVIKPYHDVKHRGTTETEFVKLGQILRLYIDMELFNVIRIRVGTYEFASFVHRMNYVEFTLYKSHCSEEQRCDINLVVTLKRNEKAGLFYLPVSFQSHNNYTQSYVVGELPRLTSFDASIELSKLTLNLATSHKVHENYRFATIFQLYVDDSIVDEWNLPTFVDRHEKALDTVATKLGPKRSKNITIAVSPINDDNEFLTNGCNCNYSFVYEFKVIEMSVKRDLNVEQTVSAITAQWEFNLKPSHVANVANTDIQLRFYALHNDTLVHTIDHLSADTIKVSKNWTTPESLKFEPFRVKLTYLDEVLSETVSQIPNFVLLDAWLVEERKTGVTPDQILRIQWRSHDGRTDKNFPVKGNLVCESTHAFVSIDNLNDVHEVSFRAGDFSCPEDLVLQSADTNSIRVPKTAYLIKNDAFMVQWEGADLKSTPGQLALSWQLQWTKTAVHLMEEMEAQKGVLTVILRDVDGVQINNQKWKFECAIGKIFSLNVELKSLLQSHTKGSLDMSLAFDPLYERQFQGRSVKFDFLDVTNFNADRLNKQLLNVTWTAPAILAPPSYLEAITLHLHYVDPASGEPYQPVIVMDLKSGYAELSLPDLRPIDHVEMIYGSNQFIAKALVEANDEAFIYKSGALDQLRMYPDENLVTTWRVIGGKKVSKVPASLQCKDKSVEIHKLEDVFGDRQLQLKAQTLMNAGCFDASASISSSVLTLHTASNIALLANVTMIQSFTISNMQYKMESSDIHFSWTVFPLPDAYLLATLQITVVGKDEAVLEQNVNLATGIFVAKSVSLPNSLKNGNLVWTLVPHRKLSFIITPQSFHYAEKKGEMTAVLVAIIVLSIIILIGFGILIFVYRRPVKLLFSKVIRRKSRTNVYASVTA